MRSLRPTLPGERASILALVAALSLATVASGAMSLALFTDQETVDGTFGSGSIALDATKVDALTLTTSDMMPGDSVTDDVVIENDGTSELRYSLSTSSTNLDAKDLRDVLTLTIKGLDVDGVGCDSFDGASVLAETALNGAGFGSPVAGADAGDRVLAAAASETLCFRVSLPSGTGNAYQGASTTTTFTFDAEQTASN